MDVVVEKSIKSLTKNDASILTQNFTVLDGTKMPVGDNHRVAYVNSTSGRADLQLNEPEHIVTAVMSVWGEQPSVEDTENVEYEPPKDVWDEMSEAIKQGVNNV